MEEHISASKLKELDGIFMSTTPIGILPIISVDDMKFNSADNKIINDIMDGYSRLVKEYIKSNK